MRHSIAALVLVTAFSGPARATTYSTDVSDLWSSAAEQGWGVNVIQQGEILFLTLFVYSPGNAAVWYVGPSVAYTGQSAGVLNFAGPLYLANGPWFGGAFNPGAVGNRQVGNVTFALTSVNTATISYTVDAAIVSKQVTRQVWRANQMAGVYVGAAIGVYSNCPGATGYTEEPGNVTVTQTASSLTLQFQGTTGSCTYTGPYTQAGRMGSISGSFTCNTGATGSFQAFEIEGSISAFTARAAFQAGACTWSGRIGGLRRGT